MRPGVESEGSVGALFGIETGLAELMRSRIERKDKPDTLLTVEAGLMVLDLD